MSLTITPVSAAVGPHGLAFEVLFRHDATGYEAAVTFTERQHPRAWLPAITADERARWDVADTRAKKRNALAAIVQDRLPLIRDRMRARVLALPAAPAVVDPADLPTPQTVSDE